jgi:hypothetical protein
MGEGIGKILFIETPRIRGVSSIEEARKLLVYDRYIVTSNTPKNILSALRTAPPGMVFEEEASDDDPNPDLLSYYIHDSVRVL